jgi:5-methylcytosine-specific restriction protein A
MPHAPRHPCRYPGCSHLVKRGKRFCAVHEEKPLTSKTWGDPTYYRTRRWRKIRHDYVKKHFLCEGFDCGRRAREVHHIIEVRKGGSDADDNLMALCKPCHSRRTRRGK